MAKSNLYTRTGDAGSTSLVGGTRIAKDSTRLEAYGAVDELSSFLGALAAEPALPPEQQGQLMAVQNLLFNIGAYLATSPKEGEESSVSGLTEKTLQKIEGWIDSLDERVPPIRAFILPGGTQAAASAHVARAVARRGERRIIKLASAEYVDPVLIAYVNRLSDYLFILARFLNFIAGVEEVTWNPKATEDS